MPFFSTLSEEYGAVLTISMDWEWNKRFYTLCCHNVSRIVNNLWVLYSFLFLCSTKPRSLLSQLSTVLLFYIKIKVAFFIIVLKFEALFNKHHYKHRHTRSDTYTHTYRHKHTYIQICDFTHSPIQLFIRIHRDTWVHRNTVHTHTQSPFAHWEDHYLETYLPVCIPLWITLAWTFVSVLLMHVRRTR